jgi:AbrB family looped-hinge helix DNA binding protein
MGTGMSMTCLNRYEKYDIIHYSYPLGRVSGMESGFFKQNAPKFYGATTVGERGQVVIPAEARRDFEITPATKLLVFGSRGHGGLMLTKAETFSEFITKATGMLTRLEEILKMDRDSNKASK